MVLCVFMNTLCVTQSAHCTSQDVSFMRGVCVYLFALQTDSWHCDCGQGRSVSVAAGGSPHCSPMASMEDGGGLNTHVTFEV